MSESTGSSAQCPICLKGPFLLSNLYRHMKGIHGCDEKEVQQMKDDVKNTIFHDNGTDPCEICGKMYFSRPEKTIRMTEAHGIEKNGNVVSCPGCPCTFGRQIELSRHCFEQHSDEGGDFIVRRNSAVQICPRVGRVTRNVKLSHGSQRLIRGQH